MANDPPQCGSHRGIEANIQKLLAYVGAENIYGLRPLDERSLS
jgi:hypothetical protein